MSGIMDYITSLDWANNWLTYIFTVILVSWLGILTIKLVFNKLAYLIKKGFYLILIMIVATIVSYVLFLAGVIDFDILSLVGLGGISDSIQSFFENLHSWFKETFALGVKVVKFLK